MEFGDGRVTSAASCPVQLAPPALGATRLARPWTDRARRGHCRLPWNKGRCLQPAGRLQSLRRACRLRPHLR
eukprot:257897-Pleurochrysis_carterae.AAC.1